jgi:hypothetical protein
MSSQSEIGTHEILSCLSICRFKTVPVLSHVTWRCSTCVWLFPAGRQTGTGPGHTPASRRFPARRQREALARDIAKWDLMIWNMDRGSFPSTSLCRTFCCMVFSRLHTQELVFSRLHAQEPVFSRLHAQELVFSRLHAQELVFSKL